VEKEFQSKEIGVARGAFRVFEVVSQALLNIVSALVLLGALHVAAVKGADSGTFRIVYALAYALPFLLALHPFFLLGLYVRERRQRPASGLQRWLALALVVVPLALVLLETMEAIKEAATILAEGV
jgi:hypothetical protein